MRLDNTFSVTAPRDEVWDALMDFQRVAGCVPGATAIALSDDTFEVTMRVKVGPIVMQYKGTLEVVERDAAAHRAVLSGKAQEVKGQGTAEGTIELHLLEDGEVTRGTCSADVKLSGRAAAMGRGVISKVGEQLMGQFATNLQALLGASGPGADAGGAAAALAERSGETVADDPGVPERSGDTVVEGIETLAEGTQWHGVLRDPDQSTPLTAPVEQVEGDRDMTEGRRDSGPGKGTRTDVPTTRMPEAPVSGGAQSSPSARVSDRVSASGQAPPRARDPAPTQEEPEALDGLALVGGMVREQVGRPRFLAGMALPVALLVAFLLGRRSTRR